MGAAAGWYPDPGGTGGQRYFDGSVWTGHSVPAPWKGARYGRPATGAGSLASPSSRLVARIFDWLVFLSVLVVLTGIMLAIVLPLAGPLFPSTNAEGATPTPGFLWLYLGFAIVALVTGLLFVAYETIAIVRYGRTLGKAWMHIRPIGTRGELLGWGRAFGRSILYYLAGWLGWIGLLDPLWCLWDADTQCIHDKVVNSLVINDR